MVASTSLMGFRRALDELQSGAVPFRECDSRVDVKNGKARLAIERPLCPTQKNCCAERNNCADQRHAAARLRANEDAGRPS